MDSDTWYSRMSAAMSTGYVRRPVLTSSAPCKHSLHLKHLIFMVRRLPLGGERRAGFTKGMGSQESLEVCKVFVSKLKNCAVLHAVLGISYVSGG